MEISTVKKLCISIYIIYSLVTISFIGILAFEGLVDKGSVEAANTLFVGGLGVGNYSKIQDAIDVANTGDTIRVYDGIYKENVKVNKRVILIGNGTLKTTIDGG